jgi:hypothetical protein
VKKWSARFRGHYLCNTLQVKETNIHTLNRIWPTILAIKQSDLHFGLHSHWDQWILIYFPVLLNLLVLTCGIIQLGMGYMVEHSATGCSHLKNIKYGSNKNLWSYLWQYSSNRHLHWINMCKEVDHYTVSLFIVFASPHWDWGFKKNWYCMFFLELVQGLLFVFTYKFYLRLSVILLPRCIVENISVKIHVLKCVTFYYWLLF